MPTLTRLCVHGDYFSHDQPLRNLIFGKFPSDWQTCKNFEVEMFAIE